jgi:hypothetical protein
MTIDSFISYLVRTTINSFISTTKDSSTSTSIGQDAMRHCRLCGTKSLHPTCHDYSPHPPLALLLFLLTYPSSPGSPSSFSHTHTLSLPSALPLALSFYPSTSKYTSSLPHLTPPSASIPPRRHPPHEAPLLPLSPSASSSIGHHWGGGSSRFYRQFVFFPRAT